MRAVWLHRQVVCCVGTGGVGKTTVAAALGLAAAAAGKKTLVMTIDPARRLANALGLEDFGNAERQVLAEHVAPFGVQLQAPLWVMMPDVKSTFDTLIERTASSAEQRQRIFQNKVYQHFSTKLAGSLEYAAVEKLYEVHASGVYDLIVLDTPPSQNAADFLEAPGRIIDFLNNETVRWFLKPYQLAGRLSLKFFDVGSAFFLRTLGRLAGAETLRELAEFLLNFQGMYDGFKQRSKDVKELLASSHVAFVLVSATSKEQQQSMQRFRQELAAKNLWVRQVVVNRVRSPFNLPEPLSAASLSLQGALEGLAAAERQQVLLAIDEEHTLAQRDHAALALIREAVDDIPTLALPELPLDVHDLASLAALCHHFLDERGENRDTPTG